MKGCSVVHWITDVDMIKKHDWLNRQMPQALICLWFLTTAEACCLNVAHLLQQRQKWRLLGTLQRAWQTRQSTRRAVHRPPHRPRLFQCPCWDLRRYPADTHQLRFSTGRAPSEASRHSVRRRLPSNDSSHCAWMTCPPLCSASLTSPWKTQVSPTVTALANMHNKYKSYF